MRTKSSPAKKKKTAPATQEPEAHDPSEMQLQIVESSPSSPMSRSPIKLPGGWVVEQRPRVTSAGHPGRVDRYYYEPGSGKQFRSLIAVQKYLSQEMDYTLANATQGQRVKPRDYESMQIVPHVFRSATPFKLPHDWTVEEKPRSNINYAGVVDRYYIEPGTGHRFRSLRAVERYLAEQEARAAASEVSKAGTPV
ncbi:Methyl-CpG DNA binding protein [Corchorus capsularis]|uniref:Methyl-CpG DNA binding protein n=1 Tax=Corchorus capsularis TaxID=210143 RepID=A0A1R3HBQ5_COCAP|nr:Methyl-CpG DNA binding protein [Corchorus capsularis]